MKNLRTLYEVLITNRNEGDRDAYLDFFVNEYKNQVIHR